jgi:hypothetical protein
MQGGGALVIAVAGLAGVAGTGCQLQLGARQLGSRPRRAGAEGVRLGIVAPDQGAAPALEEGMRRDPHVAAIELFPDPASLPAAERAACRATGCEQRHPTVCAWSRARGLDYFAVAEVRVFERRAPTLSVQARGAHLGDAYAATALLDLEVAEAATCRKVDQLTRHLSLSTDLPPQAGGGPQLAVQQLLASVAGGAFADTFPIEAVIDGAGHVRGAGPGEPAVPDGLYALFRDGGYLGLVDVRGARTPAEEVRRLACCFLPRPDDQMAQRDPHRLLELAPSLSAAALIVDGRGRAAPGFGVHARSWPVTSGWQGGLALDFLFTGGASVGLGTVEGGYRWRGGPAWTLALLAGAGGGFGSGAAADVAGQAQARGAHALGALSLDVQPGRGWFTSIDAGYVYSTRYAAAADGTQPALAVRGPLVRLTVGLR